MSIYSPLPPFFSPPSPSSPLPARVCDAGRASLFFHPLALEFPPIVWPTYHLTHPPTRRPWPILPSRPVFF
ncbi:hypothetical protein C8Q73DRAFT_671667 [Cubamyces lactineus]|nr:hypothetical protein C8Q73DRAFT_671667 [Cubamyces lactineus]